MILRSSVNRVFRTSMEVGVKVIAEDLTDRQKVHTCSAYLTFVALDENRKATPVAPVIPESEEEQRRYREAGERREYPPGAPAAYECRPRLGVLAVLVHVLDARLV